MGKLAMTLKEVADGAPFDVATIVRLLAGKVDGLTGAGDETGPGEATMDAGEAGATLEGAVTEDTATGGELPRKTAGRKREQG